MKVTEIIVQAGRTFNHPHEQYSNLKPSVALKAQLTEGDDPIAATKQLQAQAEGLVEDHKNHLLQSLEDLYQLGQRQEEIRGLQRQLTTAQDWLDQIRKQHPELLQLPAPEQTEAEREEEKGMF
jgi:ABC-type Fe2+-enterobactin transport system substrate-binding protein